MVGCKLNNAKKKIENLIDLFNLHEIEFKILKRLGVFDE